MGEPAPASPLLAAKVEPPAAAPAPPSPKVVAALAALEKLQEATESPLPTDDYTARIEEAKRAVEPALGDASSEPEVRTALGAAVRYHSVAALARGVFESRGDLAALGRNPVVTSCRPLTDLVARDARELQLDASDPTVIGLLTATEGVPALRACAGEQIAEAERRARGAR